MKTFNETINLTPYWTADKPNIILVAQYYTTSGYKYSATVTGPGLPPEGIFFSGKESACITRTLTNKYEVGQTLQYKIAVTTNSGNLQMYVQNSTVIGLKPDGDAISYQGCFFSNDDGSDKDWNDCVITLSMFNNSTD